MYEKKDKNNTCCICGKEFTKYIQCADGRVCVHCAEKLPKCLGRTANTLRKKEIEALLQIAKPVQFPGPVFHISGIFFAYTNIAYESLNKIKFTFHPFKARENQVYGAITLDLYLKDRRLMLREELLRTCIPYHIGNGVISYSMPNIMTELEKEVNKCIMNQTFCMADAFFEMGYGTSFDLRKWIVNQINKSSQKKTNSGTSQNRNTNSGSFQNRQSIVFTEEDLKAMKILQVTYPFTEEQLKHQMRKLAKEHHPDSNHNMDTEAIRDINVAYGRLEKFAKK